MIEDEVLQGPLEHVSKELELGAAMARQRLSARTHATAGDVLFLQAGNAFVQIACQAAKVRDRPCHQSARAMALQTAP